MSGTSISGCERKRRSIYVRTQLRVGKLGGRAPAHVLVLDVFSVLALQFESSLSKPFTRFTTRSINTSAFCAVLLPWRFTGSSSATTPRSHRASPATRRAWRSRSRRVSGQRASFFGRSRFVRRRLADEPRGGAWKLGGGASVRSVGESRRGCSCGFVGRAIQKVLRCISSRAFRA